MQIELAYGLKGLEINVPDRNLAKVFSIKPQAVVFNPYISLVKSLLRPIGLERSLFDISRYKNSACIVIPDITRPMPNELILAPILRTLHAAGIAREQISILIATGTHRPNSKKELEGIVGKEILKAYRVINHDCNDLETHINVGQSPSGIDTWIDKRYVEAELKIATGFIEPHFMAGFSGGRKSIVPGVAAYETIKHLHGPELMAHPQARQGVLEGNPFHEELLAMAKMAGIDFVVNVTLGEDKEITGIFSGDLEKAHLQGVEAVRSFVQDTIPEPVDVAITTGAGYPLDATWYQTIKGVCAAADIVKPGGTIIVASECSEGIGSNEFSGLLKKYQDLDQFERDIRRKEIQVKDQWQLQKYVVAAKKARVVLVSDKLHKSTCERIHVEWAPTVERIMDELIAENPDLTVAVLPKGPYILAGLETQF